jgi:hypothetical protein
VARRTAAGLVGWRAGITYNPWGPSEVS